MPDEKIKSLYVQHARRNEQQGAVPESGTALSVWNVRAGGFCDGSHNEEGSCSYINDEPFLLYHSTRKKAGKK